MAPKQVIYLRIFSTVLVNKLSEMIGTLFLDMSHPLHVVEGNKSLLWWVTVRRQTPQMRSLRGICRSFSLKTNYARSGRQSHMIVSPVIRPADCSFPFAALFCIL